MIKFKQQYSLLPSKHDFSILYRYGFTTISHKHTSDMRMSIETLLFAITHCFGISMFKIIMSVYFINENIIITPLFEIIPEPILCFVDFKHCGCMTRKNVEQSILTFMISNKFFYIISNIYDIKRFFFDIFWYGNNTFF